jgi:hypothetical protein
MLHLEREKRPDNLPPLIEQLKRFVEAPKPGEKPLVYFATRQTGFQYPDRDKSKPNLYRADQLTIEQFMAEVFPVSEYGDYRDLKKAEEWVMPGLDCYVVPIVLDQSVLDWSFAGELAGVLGPMLQGGQPNWDAAIDEALGVEEPADEIQAMVQGVEKYMATLLPVFRNSGPLDLPHFHASVCFALDSYAQEWLGIASYQIGTDDEGKTPVQIFNERYGSYDLRYGRMMTVRYTSYKPGMLDALLGQLQQGAVRELGNEPDVLQERVASVADELSQLQADEIFFAYWQHHAHSGKKTEVQIIADYLTQLSSDHPQRARFQELHDQLSNLYGFAQQVDDLARQHFNEVSKAYFGLSAGEFEQAYQRRLKWLIKERDKALVEVAQRLGVSAMFEKRSYDIDWFRPISIDDFPPGGIILKQDADQIFDGKPSRMIVAYPAANPVEDLPTISSGQFSRAVDEVAQGSNGFMVITNDQELNDIRDQYVQGEMKYRSQYQSLRASDITSGNMNLETINDSTEVIFITGFTDQESTQTEAVQSFILDAWRKIVREGRHVGVGPRVVVFADGEVSQTSWLPEGSRKGHLVIADREVTMEVRS